MATNFPARGLLLPPRLNFASAKMTTTTLALTCTCTRHYCTSLSDVGSVTNERMEEGGEPDMDDRGSHV